jgi:hypothetical protein
MDQLQDFISQTVRGRRIALGLTQELTAAGGPSRSTIVRAEHLGVLPKRPFIRASFAKALSWRYDACDLLAKGELPVDLR